MTGKGDKAVSVSLSDLEIDEEMQPRRRLNRDAIARYTGQYKAAGLRALPPITAARLVGKDIGKLYVVDGHHRVLAARNANLKRLFAHTLECSEQEARWLAAAANMEHGVPLRHSEHREAFRRFIEAKKNVHPDGALMSYRKIEETFGRRRSHQTIATWMREDFPKLADKMGRGMTEETPPNSAFTRPNPLDLLVAQLYGLEKEMLRTAERISEHPGGSEEAASALAGLQKRMEAALESSIEDEPYSDF